MELRRRLTRWALRRPHVMLVAAPGCTTLRWDVEASLQRRGWAHATSPADADLLLTAGDLGEGLGAAADLLWSQVPRPRHRAVLAVGAVEQGLDDAAGALLADAADRQRPPPPDHVQPTDQDHGGEGDAADGGETDGGHDDHDMGGHDMGGHDMGGHVAGLPMAGGAPDRDGLELDALTVRLGPVLPGWPTGLVVTATLQGDVLTGVRTTVTAGPGSEPREETSHPTMRALDALERLLVVAGWSTAARDTARLRSQLWDAGSTTSDLARRGRRLTEQVRRSRTLAWALRDLPEVEPRLRAWCDAVAAGLEGSAGAGAVDPVPLEDLTALLDGLDLGSARLVVASLPLDLTAPVDAAAGR